MVIDECQNLFSHEEYGAEAGKVAMDIIRMGRAYGVVLILCTQRPDTTSLPKGVSANASVKICLRMTDHTAVDMVLGTGAHGRGLKAELFKQSERGVGYVLGVADDDIVARSYYIDAIAADRIAERAHALREAEDRLTGHALGVEADAAEEKAAGVDLLDDLREVLTGQGLEWMWNVSAAGALATLRPDAWGGLNESTLGALLAKRGVPTKPMNRKDPLDPPGSPRRNLVGFELADLETAIQDRKRPLRVV
jgi:S-DNA-T family DNA segregation ATPase FtsK/SpoIIIE